MNKKVKFNVKNIQNGVLITHQGKVESFQHAADQDPGCSRTVLKKDLGDIITGMVSHALSEHEEVGVEVDIKITPKKK